jgi:hypothetical protein
LLLSNALSASLILPSVSKKTSEKLWRSDVFLLNTGVSLFVSNSNKATEASWDSSLNIFLPEGSNFIGESFRVGFGANFKLFGVKQHLVGFQIVHLLPALQSEFRPWLSVGFFPSSASNLKWEFASGVVESPLHFFVWTLAKEKKQSSLPVKLGISVKLPLY